MPRIVEPKVFLVGFTNTFEEGLEEYLRYTGQMDFWEDYKDALALGISEGEALCSFFAKLCYKSLVIGKNDNLSKIRDVKNNLMGTFDQGHGSVFEHCWLNFVVTDCSRVFTHELVRHRVGTAFSQTSGRYVRGDTIDFVFDPILEPVKEEGEELLEIIERYYRKMVDKLGLNEMKEMEVKKRMTSALRRFLPNGQGNEIGFSVNIRELRHFVMVRTSRHAEWEIREIGAQVYELVREKFPMIFYGAKEEMVRGVVEVSGMKLQPYEK